MKAQVIEIQVGGGKLCYSLAEACEAYPFELRSKIYFLIELPNGDRKQITIRDEDAETVAYGDFKGLPSFMDYAKEIAEELIAADTKRNL